MQGRTTLILAHRLSSVIDCDRILVLDGGKVSEQGRHDELMSRGGVYATLMSEQARESSSDATVDVLDVRTRTETIADTPGGAVKPLTEGIIKAEGLSWWQLVSALMAMARAATRSVRAASRSLNSRSTPTQVRKPCSGCGRLARIAMTSPSVSGPIEAAHRRKRSGVHSAYRRCALGM